MTAKGYALKVEPVRYFADENEVPHIHQTEIEYEDGSVWLENEIGGWVEHYNLSSELYNANIECWIDEDGKRKDLDPTFALADDNGHIVDYLVGPVVFTSFDSGGNTGPLSPTQYLILYRWLTSLRIIGCKYQEKVNVVLMVNGFNGN